MYKYSFMLLLPAAIIVFSFARQILTLFFGAAIAEEEMPFIGEINAKEVNLRGERVLDPEDREDREEIARRAAADGHEAPPTGFDTAETERRARSRAEVALHVEEDQYRAEQRAAAAVTQEPGGPAL